MVIHTLHRFVAEYGHAVLLALLVHALILTLLLTTKFSRPVQLPVAEPITSFLYQPPLPAAPPPLQQAANALAPDIATTNGPNRADEPSTQAAASNDSGGKLPPALKPLPTKADETGQHDISEDQAKLGRGKSLAQRALNRVAEPDYAAVEQAANASYQQFLQKQQQPRLTVDKKHWPISQDPKAQVVAQLDDGSQIIRTKGGCRIADPTLDGFEALMAANPIVPCGDETPSSELLKQALDKHIKR